MVHSKWFLEALGHDGLNKLVEPYEDRSAQAVCTFAFSYGPGQEVFLFQGRTEVSNKVLFLIRSEFADGCGLGENRACPWTAEFRYEKTFSREDALVLTINRLGSDFRVRGPYICRDGQGGEGMFFSPPLRARRWRLTPKRTRSRIATRPCSNSRSG